VTPLAHGIGQSTDLPLPLDLVLQAGAATVVISFLGSALLWRRSRLTGGVERHPRTTGWLPPLRWAVLALSLYLVLDAIFGPRGPRNPAPYALYVWLWVGLVPLSIVFGPVWRAVNPLRTILRLARPTAPARSGRPWLAVAGLLAFVWLELVAPARADPRVVGLCVLGYAAVQLGSGLRGDFLETYSDLAGRLSPLRWRPPLSGLAVDHPTGAGRPARPAVDHAATAAGPAVDHAATAAGPAVDHAATAAGPAVNHAVGAGRAAFLAVWWGSTIFDSASGSPAWAGFVQRVGHPVLWGTAGLILVCGVVFLGVRALSGRLDVTNSLIPIAVGYTLAHYLTLLLVEGPHGGLLLVQQWGIADGAVVTFAPDPRVVSVLQVALILAGHAIGVLAAHDLALADTPDRPPLAVLADELPVVLFMIACTWVGLFLLFVR
jgi:type IV secretory pathway VirB2 component (pilin)